MDLSNGTSWPPQPTPPDGGTRAVDVRVVATKGPKGKINVEAKRNGDTFAAKTLDPDHAEQRLQFARKAGVGVEAVIAAIRTVTPSPKPDDATTAASHPAPFAVAMRGLGRPKGEGHTFEADEPLDALRQALAVTDYAAAEPVLEWADTERLAVVDVDYHDRDLDQRPDPAALEALARAVVPHPALFWTTHGRGLRLVYAALQRSTAAELAACAAVGVRSRDPAAGVEILHHTRHPAYPRPEYPAAGPVREGTPTADLGVLARWLGREVEAAAVEEWLAENGYARSGRYEHSRCPLDPQSPSHDKPVQVGEEGIHCFKCEATGLTLGSRKAGWFPWSALVGGGVPARLAAAVRRFCHWEHAQHIVAEDAGLTGDLAQLAYQALLKAVHGPQDPRIDTALRAGRGLVRMDGCWATADLSRNHHRDGLTARLAALPAVQALEPDKDSRLVARVVPERLAIFQGVDDLALYGYPRVLPVRGMKIFHQWHQNPDPAVVRAVVLPEFLRPDGMAPFRPRYVPAGKRMPLAAAEARLSASFPGINFDYLRLLIAARGCAEGGLGLPPRVAVDGPSGAGKDATVKIAAALIGDNHRDLPYKPQAERFHLDLYDAGLNAGLVTSQEIMKFASARGEDLLSNLKALMNFEKGTSVRVLYVGPQPVRQVPVFVITDTSFPPAVHCDEQLGRRFVYVHLPRKVDWQRSSLEGIERWRALGKEHAAAANALVSDVIDTFFADPAPKLFEEIAHQLGFGALNQGNDMGLDPRADLLELFAACCSPEATPAKDGKWKGKGWKLVRREGADRLSKAWLRVCDNLGDGFTSSRRAKEVDWAQVLQVDRPVEFDCSPNGGSTLGVRFRQGKARSLDLKVNEEIRGPDRPPDPLPPDAPPEDPPPASPPPAPVAAPGPATSAKDAPRVADVPVVAATFVAAAPRAGPAAPVLLDLETRSASNLPEEGGRRYAAHPSTEILTGVALIDGRVIAWAPTLAVPPTGDLWPDGYGFPRQPVEVHVGLALPPPLAEALAAGRPLCAHNALDFDRHVWRARGLPEPSAWLDTLRDARAAGLPGKLDELGRRLLGVGKDKEGEALVRRLCRPDQRGLFPPLTSAAAARLLRYNVADVLLLARLYGVVGGRAEPEVVALDDAVNERGVAFDVGLAEALIRLERQAAREAGEEAERVTAGALKAGDFRRRELLLRWLRSRGVDLSDLKKDTVERLLRGGGLAEDVRRVLEARQAINRITAGKLERARAACHADGRLRDLLVYHKAHTGRWAGRQVQPHNLPRPPHDLQDLGPLLESVHDLRRFREALPASVGLADALSALVRPCFRAGPGKLLCSADFASIEARGTAWCARERRLLELFEQGGDAYCDFATAIFARPITKETKRERGVGKEAVLGCGYAMGPPRFAKQCAARGVDLAAAGVTAEMVVEGYRDAYPAIAGTKVGWGDRTWRRGGMWNDVEAAAREAVEKGTPGDAGRCQFSREDDALVIRLPSGRRLYYRNARIEPRVPAYCLSLGLPPTEKPTIVFDGDDEPGVTTYGGKLTENIVQAVCRDLLVAALRECERQGLPVVLHVHDEVVIEIPAGQADQALRRLAEIMSTPPAWAEGFPIEVEAFAAERYLKNPPTGAPQIKARGGRIV